MCPVIVNNTILISYRDESGNMRAAMPVRFSRITRARASSGISKPTTVGPGTSTKKPPEMKKAMKMRTTKSTTARFGSHCFSCRGSSH